MTKPVVEWQDPTTVPDVPKYETKTFWVVVESFGRQHVFDAQYCNKILDYKEDDPDCEDEPLDPYHFVTQDGEPIDCVGWYDVRNHQDFDGYYEPLNFNDHYKLLAWAEYEKPDFNGQYS